MNHEASVGRCNDEKSPDKRRFLSEADSLHPGRTIGFDKRARVGVRCSLNRRKRDGLIVIGLFIQPRWSTGTDAIDTKWPEESVRRSQVKATGAAGLTIIYHSIRFHANRQFSKLIIFVGNSVEFIGEVIDLTMRARRGIYCDAARSIRIIIPLNWRLMLVSGKLNFSFDHFFFFFFSLIIQIFEGKLVESLNMHL